MIGRLLVVASGIAASAVAAAAVWTRRKNELDAEAAEAEAAEAPMAIGVASEPARPREVGVAPLTPASPADEAAHDEGDDLQSIKGLGGVSEEELRHEGVTTFAQIAAWSDDDIDAMAAKMSLSPERIRREDWVGQAKAIIGERAEAS